MRTASAAARLPVRPAVAMEMFWDMDRWRRFWAPIEQVQVTYQDPCHQEFVMRVKRDGAVEQVRTIRYRRTARIEFFSPQPPPMMHSHVGEWVFEETSDGSTLAIANRRYELRPTVADPEQFNARFSARLGAILDGFAAALLDGTAQRVGTSQ